MNFTFNIFDTVGRKMGGITNIPDKLLIILVILRVVFIPTTILTAT